MSREKCSVSEQREMLQSLQRDGHFLHTDRGVAFLEQLRTFIVPRVLAEGRRLGLGSNWTCAEEVLNSAIICLSKNQGRIARYAAAAAEEPWAYLSACVLRHCRAEWGVRGVQLLEASLPQLYKDHENSALTPLGEVVDRTFAVLSESVESVQRRRVRALVVWLANNPPERVSYEAVERRAAERLFADLGSDRIAAVMNITWGVRPRRAETSLMAAFLRDPNFRYSDSPSHSRAVVRFRRVMRKANSVSLVLPKALAA